LAHEALFVAGILLLVGSVSAQGQNARLSADIVDATDGLSENAEVKRTNEGTQREFVTTTGSARQFSFPPLMPATYSIQLRADGFKTLNPDSGS
jgi:hypothetical protein